MLELYHSPISTCSQKVRLALAEKGLPWSGHPIRFNQGEHLSDWYLKLNPNGVVPTLVHDGAVITDSSVINEYLEDVYPEPALRPRAPVPLAHMRAWRQYIDEVPTVAIRAPSFNAFFVPIWSKLTDEEFLAYSERLPLRKHFYRRMGRGGFSAADIAASLEQLDQALLRMEAALERGPWLNGDDFTLADISMLPTVVRMEDLGLSHLWAARTGVTGWYRRVRDRPSFAQAYMPGSRVLGPAC